MKNRQTTSRWLGMVLACTVTHARAEKFTITVIPDTQNYTTSDANMAGFTAQMDFIATNRVARNIVFATHLGDMIDGNGWAFSQWARAQAAMNILRDSDIPYGIAIGNHDFDYGPGYCFSNSMWSARFGPGSTYFQNRPWYHANPNNAPDSYQLFYGAGRVFLHIVLDLEPSVQSLQWAQQVIAQHAGLPTIVSLHQYLTYNNNRSSNNYRGGSTGLQIWDDFVSVNPQIFLVLCGHSFDPTGGVGQVRRTSVNAVGQPVFELLSDYQRWRDTGGGWMRLMEFDSDLQCINVTTYTPLLDIWSTSSASQFTLSFNWNARFGPAPGQVAPMIITEPASQTVTRGDKASFRVFAVGSAPLSYQWCLNGAGIGGATAGNCSLTNIQENEEGIYSVTVSNSAGMVVSSEAFLRVNCWPVADASNTQPLVLSANGSNAMVVLNGTASSDPDDDLLEYRWFLTLNSQPATIIGYGPVAVVNLPVGIHSLALVVNDGLLAGTNAFTVEVIIPSDAVERLATAVDADTSRAQPLISTLSAALASIDRGNPVSAINQLLAFQNKVNNQIAPLDSRLAADLVQQAQEIIEALSGGGTNPGGRPHGRFSSVAQQGTGQVTLRFSADPGPLYILEASTNLADWEMIDVAVGRGDGTLLFEDKNAIGFAGRCYRVVTP